tara:strand:+ start:378 stop:683 length:306 start_codon:yes stop_codon:yes gene_type:complete
MKEKENLIKELEWWRTYGEYVSEMDRNLNEKACIYADGDEDEDEDESHYPFNEGDIYWTIEHGHVERSMWDVISEELYDENPDTPLFESEEEAFKFLTKNK